MERGRGGRGRGGRGGRGGPRINWGRGIDNGDRGGRGRGRGGRGGHGGPTHLTTLAWEEARQSIKENMISNLKKILQSYPELCNQLRDNKTLLLHAMNDGNKEAIEFLLSLPQINLNVEVQKRTVVDLAAKIGDEDTVWRLMSGSSNTQGKPFLSAMEGGNAQLAQQLMKRLYSSPKEAARDHRGDFTLAVHFAKSVECLKLVLPHSDVNAVSFLYGTPLQAALKFENLDVAEYLVDHVPEVEFEPESWINSTMDQSPLYLALCTTRRSIVEKLLNSGKCQRTLDSMTGCPTPEEFLAIYDRHHNIKKGDDETPAVVPKPQKVAYAPPKVSKEDYLNSIFKLLNVPAEERAIFFEDPTKNQPVVPVDSIYNYASLEECPSSLLRKFLADRVAEPDPNTLHHELVEKVKTLKINIEKSTPELQKSEDVEIIMDREKVNAIPNIIPFDKFTGFYERDGRKHYMKLDLLSQKGSSLFLDLKVPGAWGIFRTHFFNQNSFYLSKYVTVLTRPRLHSTVRLTEGLSFRIVNSLVRDAFESKVVLEKTEPGVELFYGDTFFSEHDDIGEDAGGRIFMNNGRIFVFFAVRRETHLEKLGYELSMIKDEYDEYDEDEYSLIFPLPRMPYTFYVGEVKVKPGATDLKDGAVIEGTWWETQLEKYVHSDIFNEQHFSAAGKFKLVAPFTDDDRAMLRNDNQANFDGDATNQDGDDEIEVWD